MIEALNAAGDKTDLLDRFQQVGLPHDGGACSDSCWTR